MNIEKTILMFIHISILGQCSNSRDEVLFEEKLLKELSLNFTKLAMKYGKSVEEHEVVSEDGYILTVFHVTGVQNPRRDPPVLIQHGLTDSADNFLMLGNISLVVTLADAGYDVWLGNTRGNRYSRRHKKMNPDKDIAFWDYSIHECGLFDLSAIIDFVLNKTGVKTFNAIAVSQGTAQFLVLGSLRAEYNKKVNLMIGFAPAAFLHNAKAPISYAVSAIPLINFLLANTGQDEVLPYQGLLKLGCTHSKILYETCAKILLKVVVAKNPKHFEKELLTVFIGHYYQVTSRKSIYHLGQIGIRKRFAQFDYGLLQNFARYGSWTPPDYKLTSVTMKVALFVGKNDVVATIEDVALLKQHLPNVVEYHVLESYKWSHTDWIWDRNVNKEVYPHLFKILEKYS